MNVKLWERRNIILFLCIYISTSPNYNSSSIWRPSALMQSCQRRTKFCHTWNYNPGVALMMSLAARIHASSSSAVSTGVSSTRLFAWPHKKKSSGVRSGERAGHGTGPPLPIHFPGNVRLLSSMMWKVSWGSIMLKPHTSTWLQWDMFQQQQRKFKTLSAVPSSRFHSKPLMKLPDGGPVTYPNHLLYLWKQRSPVTCEGDLSGPRFPI